MVCVPSVQMMRTQGLHRRRNRDGICSRPGRSRHDVRGFPPSAGISCRDGGDEVRWWGSTQVYPQVPTIWKNASTSTAKVIKIIQSNSHLGKSMPTMCFSSKSIPANIPGLLLKVPMNNSLFNSISIEANILTSCALRSSGEMDASFCMLYPDSLSAVSEKMCHLGLFLLSSTITLKSSVKTKAFLVSDAFPAVSIYL